MKDNWVLHGYYKQLESKLRRIKSCELCSEINQKYFLEYADFLLAEGLTVPRISKCLRLAVKLDEVLNKDLKKLDKKDVIHYLGFIEKSKYSDWTKNDFKIGLKKFIRWLHNDKEPDYLKMVKTGVRDANKLLPQEILSEEEVLKLISESPSVRDKALISCLYESGCRIGEILTLKLKHVVFDEYGVILNVNGKTGVRQVRLISSTSLLSQWISDHPHKEDTDAYLWCSYRYKTNELIGYKTVSKVLKQLAKQTGLNKKVNPHSFRHARVLNKDIDYLIDNFNPAKKSPNLYVYSSNPAQFNNQQIIKRHFLATDYDIYIDLLHIGRTKEALKFMKNHKLF